MKFEHYSQLAELFDFPGPGFSNRVRVVLESLEHEYPGAAMELREFLQEIPQATLDLEELHTRTFDVQSLTTLDLGYILFGDDYKRGALLSNLGREHAQVGNDCRGELADHLPSVLRLVAKLKDQELRNELVRHILLPALIVMIREFEPERIERKNDNYRKYQKTLIDSARAGNPRAYQLALKAVLEVAASDFSDAELNDMLSEPCSRPQTMDFLNMTRREMEIEQTANPINSGCGTYAPGSIK